MVWSFFAKLSAMNSVIITSFLRKKATGMVIRISKNCSRKLGVCALLLKLRKGYNLFITIFVNPVDSSISAGVASMPRSTVVAGVVAT